MWQVAPAVAQRDKTPRETTQAETTQPAPRQRDTTRGDRLLKDYFAAETKQLAGACLADVKSLDDWKAKRERYRRQLFDMLGLNPLPEKTNLNPRVTGTIERDDFRVEKLVFESRPKLYVTANLYLPKDTSQPCPTILYLSGHSRVIKDGVSYGNKTDYQQHGEWFARNGYICLILDTIQWGEILGSHHGTYDEGQWWWNNHGYTPAGVEAWNCIRALDYLETRPEVDRRRFGATGRSGGGAYSWWIAALDERIRAAAPVAGITDLENYVVDGCVEGHCDCMFFINTERWDYPQVAALVAPRALLIENTDRDSLFPLEGVVRLHHKVRAIYQLYGAEDQLGL
ncbi:MAG TPA: CocE/NonD family hydrolase, partial [Pirellulales bacterium]|nr:CocE/NonD family hydrolase [Pirellulales bacterium]